MQRIKEIVKEILETDELTHNEDLQEKGMDSMSFVKIIVALELEYEIEFEDEDLMTLQLSTLLELETRVTELIDHNEKGD